MSNITILNELDDCFYNEAAEYDLGKTKKKGRLKRVFAAAAAAAAVLMLTLLLGNKTGVSKPLSVSAKELGQESLTAGSIGVSLPKPVYMDSQNVVFYDYRGVYVFDFSEKKLTGFADFRPLNMTRIQGDNPTFVTAEGDGKKIYFYNNEKTYCFLTEKNDVEEDIPGDENGNKIDITIDTDSEAGKIMVILAGEDGGISEDFDTYSGNGVSLSIAVDGDRAAYSDILIYKKEADGSISEYRPFR